MVYKKLSYTNSGEVHCTVLLLLLPCQHMAPNRCTYIEVNC